MLESNLSRLPGENHRGHVADALDSHIHQCGEQLYFYRRFFCLGVVDFRELMPQRSSRAA